MQIKKTFFSLLIGLVLVMGVWAQGTRPVRDDIGFCWNGPQMDRLLDYLKTVSPGEGEAGHPLLIAGISPHDDFLYAGRVYYPLHSQIKAKEVVIFGVTHREPRLKAGDPQGKLIFDTYNYWIGPYGNVKISKLREYLREKLGKESVIVNNEAHCLEHSIEAEIPFLQYFNREVQVTPVMVTAMDFETMKALSAQVAGALASYIKENNLTLGSDIFFLVSADANHYGKDFNNTPFGEDERAHELGTARDRDIAGSFLSGDMTVDKIKGLTGELWGKTFTDYKDTVWCGKYSIPFGMLTVLGVLDQLNTDKPLQGKVLLYTDTYSEGVLPLKKTGFGITAPFSLKHWVGFLSAGYYLKN